MNCFERTAAEWLRV